jgi:predicted dithiol-disulfide oxidoreductase (DUF899 family)
MKKRSRASTRKPNPATRIGGVTRKVVSPTEWRRARAAMTAREKKHMRAMDAIAAARRRMPWMKIEKPYAFEGPQGRVGLVDLFDGRTQLALYHFMFGPKVEGWPEKGCTGCSFVADQISPPRPRPRARHHLRHGLGSAPGGHRAPARALRVEPVAVVLGDR